MLFLHSDPVCLPPVFRTARPLTRSGHAGATPPSIETRGVSLFDRSKHDKFSAARLFRYFLPCSGSSATSIISPLRALLTKRLTGSRERPPITRTAVACFENHILRPDDARSRNAAI